MDKSILILQKVHAAERMGGGPFQSYLAAKGLADLGWRVYFAAERGPRNKPLDKTFLDERIKNIWLTRVYNGLEWVHIMKLRRLVKKEEISVYLTHIHTALLGVLAFLQEKPIVYMNGSLSVCNGIPIWTKEDLGRLKTTKKLFYASYYWLYNYGFNKTSLVLAQTPMQDELFRNNLNKKSVVYPGPSLLLEEETESVKLPQEPYILWIGNLVPGKRPEMFLDIVQAMPEQRFVMVGGTWGKRYASSIKERASKLPNLIDLEGINYRQSNTCVKHCILLLSTSDPIYEGFPNVFKEAWLHAKPVISMSAFPDRLIETERLGAIIEDKERVIAYLRSIVNNKNILEETGQRARLFAEREYNLERNSIYLDKLLTDLIGEG